MPQFQYFVVISAFISLFLAIIAIFRMSQYRRLLESIETRLSPEEYSSAKKEIALLTSKLKTVEKKLLESQELNEYFKTRIKGEENHSRSLETQLNELKVTLKQVETEKDKIKKDAVSQLSSAINTLSANRVDEGTKRNIKPSKKASPSQHSLYSHSSLSCNACGRSGVYCRCSM